MVEEHKTLGARPEKALSWLMENVFEPNKIELAEKPLIFKTFVVDIEGVNGCATHEIMAFTRDEAIELAVRRWNKRRTQYREDPKILKLTITEAI